MGRYQTQLANMVNLPSAAEPPQIYRALKTYLATPGVKKITSAEKGGVRLTLVTAAASVPFLNKFDKLGPAEWNDKRDGAKKVV